MYICFVSQYEYSFQRYSPITVTVERNQIIHYENTSLNLLTHFEISTNLNY